MNSERPLISNDSLMSQSTHHLIMLAITRIQYLVPAEFKLATGRLLMILVSSRQGIDKHQLLRSYYPDFEVSSAVRQRSLEMCLNKLIQRARMRYLRFGMDIHFCKARRSWLLLPYPNRRQGSGKEFLSGDNYQTF